MADLYAQWNQAALEIVQQKQINWKTHPNVTYMLEHTAKEFAHEYIDLLRSEVSNEIIQHLADLNDRHGGSVKQPINGILTSPSSIRYISHAYDICKHIISKNLNVVTLVEVGGGYGGLALIMSEVSKLFGITIEKYIIYDIPSVQALQKYYLSAHSMDMPIEWKDCSTFGSDLSSETTNFLVSCYCISELPDTYRKQYLQNILPNIKGAFFAWNWGSKEDLPVDRDERPEIPDTSGGRGNTIIRL